MVPAVPCAVSDAPARVVHLENAVHTDPNPFGSRIQVLVRLDARSRVVDATIASTGNTAVDGDALVAARASSFQTAVQGCAPVASALFVTVEVPSSRPSPHWDPPPLVDSGAGPYLTLQGTWHCWEGSTEPLRPGHDVPVMSTKERFSADPLRRTIVHFVNGAEVERFVQDDNSEWTIVRNAKPTDLRSLPWHGDMGFGLWNFIGHGTSSEARITYESSRGSFTRRRTTGGTLWLDHCAPLPSGPSG